MIDQIYTYIISLSIISISMLVIIIKLKVSQITKKIKINNNNNINVCIIGAGFGGINMAIKLKKANIKFTMFDNYDSIGGVWHKNTYPGAACDVYSHLYSYSFEPNPNWSELSSGFKEINEYQKKIVKKYNLMENIQLNTEIVSANFDIQTKKWHIFSKCGQKFISNILVSAVGALNHPNMPIIDGIDNFQGKYWHSARWKHDVNLQNKTVAIIGTGASATQIVPVIASKIKNLLVFQRTPAWIFPKFNFTYSNFAKFCFRYIPFFQKITRLGIFFYGELLYFVGIRNKGESLLGRLFHKLCIRVMSNKIYDKSVEKQLIPTEKPTCKRILLSDHYLQTFNQSNVKLITNKISKIQQDGIVIEKYSQQELLKVDIIVYCSGFKAGLNPIEKKLYGFDKTKSLEQIYGDQMHSLLGITVHGFPNYFCLYGPNTNLGSNSILVMMECQVDYIIKCLELLVNKKKQWMQTTKIAQDKHIKYIDQHMNNSVWVTGCSSWYINKIGRNTLNWPCSVIDYIWRTRRVQESDYEFD